MADAPIECELEFDIEDYVLSLPLASYDIVFNTGRKIIFDEGIYPGEPFVTGPTAARKVYRSSFDVFRLSISTQLLQERASYLSGRELGSATSLLGPHVNTDSVIQALLMAAATASGCQDRLYLEHIGIAVADYLLRQYGKRAPKGRVSPLPTWRLARIIEYIDQNLGADISLADLSGVVGISRMHFAAQFKAATGISPHAFVLQRRVRAARRLLLDRTLSIQCVARAVGFRTPAHFASVFRRHIGEAPSQWRDLIAESRGGKPPCNRRFIRE